MAYVPPQLEAGMISKKFRINHFEQRCKVKPWIDVGIDSIRLKVSNCECAFSDEFAPVKIPALCVARQVPTTAPNAHSIPQHNHSPEISIWNTKMAKDQKGTG
jgi:hypothetical protein